MEDSPHVMLIGAGASRFADTQGDIERVANDWFDTPHRLQQLREEQARERAAAAEGERRTCAASISAPSARSRWTRTAISRRRPRPAA